MSPFSSINLRFMPGAMLGFLAAWNGVPFAQAAAGTEAADEIRIVEIQGKVQVSAPGSSEWILTQTNQPLRTGYRLRTLADSRAALKWSGASAVPLGPLTEIEILPPHDPNAESGLNLIHGIFSFFHRDKPGKIRVIGGGSVAGIKGTEFVMAVTGENENERATIWMIDGTVNFSRAQNDEGALTLTNYEAAVIESGQAPRRTAGFIANNLLQWCFYYPAVLDLRDLPLTAEEEKTFSESLADYRAGDLLAALAKYPAARSLASDAGRIYYAALLLSVGQAGQAQTNLAALGATGVAEKNQRLAAALRTLIAAVKRDQIPSTLSPQLSTELLAASYYEQSLALNRESLANALNLARQCVIQSPEFGFGWERVAELEFSFGRTDRALEALNKSLVLAPRNAQALALKGFLLAAQNKTREAIDWFDRALTVDPALGNAWLGRGLCRIRNGDMKGGREDLLIAAALEPQRAALRSYLGKAWSDSGDDQRARKEFDLSRKLDPNDPTSWLYSALNNEQHNRVNEAIRDLEKSQELNKNRSVYRSGLLLDQDRAVRSANLARIYSEAGLDDVALREASRAVNSDYANYSAHLFLANSYNALRDPNQINLRYETPTFVEFLVGNLLSPVNAGVLSPAISQQEYSRLFERDRFGVISETEYLSRGAWTQSGAQYGTTGNFSYDLEGFYRFDPGQRANNDIEQRQLSLTIKQQFTPQDSLYGFVANYNADGGDLFQRYYQTNADIGLRTHEQQEPLLAIGYHHEWSPGFDTLLLVGRLQDTFEVKDTNAPGTALLTDGTIDGFDRGSFHQNYKSDTVIYSAELQELWQAGPNHFIFGTRFQYGNLKTENLLTQPEGGAAFPTYFDLGAANVTNQNSESHLERVSVYAYDLWKALDSLQLIGGISYDWITFPKDFRSDPIFNGQQTEDQISPKVGFIWTPLKKTTVRAAYTRSLAGASLEQSFQLEPSQVAGFNQLFRSIIPESISGENAGAYFETWNVSVEQKLGTGTYLAASGEILQSKVNRQTGVFISDIDVSDFAFAATEPERLDYRERTLRVRADQLLGRDWVLGASYRLTDSNLRDGFDSALTGLGFGGNTKALIQQFNTQALFNHPSGFFASAQGLWTAQSNRGYSPAEPGDNFWQFNVFAGYRSPRRHLELTLGVLNLTGRDYRLNPLTPYNELPRARTLLAQLKLDF